MSISENPTAEAGLGWAGLGWAGLGRAGEGGRGAIGINSNKLLQIVPPVCSH